MPHSLKYLNAYPETLKEQVRELIRTHRLEAYINKKYPEVHDVRSDKSLRQYVMTIKNRAMRKSPPLNQICFDNHLHVVHNALGIHSRKSHIQGSKIKRNMQIRIASQFKKAPAAFLEMIVVHELAHLKELEHNKNFYALCEYMLSDYHQRELDMRLYLTLKDLAKK